jgi:hypothetical protein
MDANELIAELPQSSRFRPVPLPSVESHSIPMNVNQHFSAEEEVL